jgi:hypothetical protein
MPIRSYAVSATAVAIATPFVLTSCHQYIPAMFNRGLGIESESVLVIPFSEPQKKRWYTESERGALAAEAFRTWAYKFAEPEFPDPESAGKALKVVRDWDRPKITGKDWQKIALGLGVKYILVGEIQSFSLEKPRTIGILEPQVTASYRLVNADTGNLAMDQPNLIVRMSHRSEKEVPQLELGSEKEEIEKKLLVRLGEKIGQELYGYYPVDG